MAVNMPAAEVEVDASLVRRLLREQHRDLAELPVVEFATGWDNVMFRLGDDLLARMPRRRIGGELIAHELAALPVLAPRLPLPVPMPVRVGRPDEEYPFDWSVVPWFAGRPLGADDLADPHHEVDRLADFFRALHRPAPDDAPANAFRGHFIGENDGIVRERLGQIGDRIDDLVVGGAARVLGLWSRLIEVAPHEGPPMWLHGDLHPLNLIVDDGRLVAVVDWGDVTAGDPACDLAIAWSLFDVPDRDRLRQSIGCDDATWARARAWALHFAVTYLAHSADHPGMDAIGVRLLPRVLDENPGAGIL